MQFKVGDHVFITDTDQVGTIVAFEEEMIVVDAEVDFELVTCDPQSLRLVERYDKAIRLPIFADREEERTWKKEVE